MNREMQDNEVFRTETVQQIIDTIEDKLLEPLVPEEIAKCCLISVSAMNLMFRLVCQMTVMEYVRCRRLSLAAQELLHSHTRIIDLAFKYGYETPEAFTKAFTRFHGFPPSLVRRIYPRCQTFEPIRIQIQISGGLIPVTDNSNLSALRKSDCMEQEMQTSFCYDGDTKTQGGRNNMNTKNKKQGYHIQTEKMKYQEDWKLIKKLAFELDNEGISFHVDGKTMIFAHGLEFPLDKICLTFQWNKEERAKKFFGETAESKLPYPGFKYFDTNYQEKKIRCMFYGGEEAADHDMWQQNAEPVRVDNQIIMVQTLEFYLENAEPGNDYYRMVEEYMNNKGSL